MTKPVKLGAAALAVALAASSAALLLPKAEGSAAVVKQDGTVLHELRLDEGADPQTYHVTGADGQYNTVLVQQGRVRMLEASCPDQVCVNQGWIGDSTLPIVCLPNKVVIEIVGEEGEFDAVAK